MLQELPPNTAENQSTPKDGMHNIIAEIRDLEMAAVAGNEDAFTALKMIQARLTGVVARIESAKTNA